jgi:hypothetical protein
MKSIMTLRISYGENCKFKTSKDLLDFFGEDWRAASHFDVFQERDSLKKEVEELKKKLEEDKKD